MLLHVLVADIWVPFIIICEINIDNKALLIIVYSLKCVNSVYVFTLIWLEVLPYSESLQEVRRILKEIIIQLMDTVQDKLLH